MAVANLGPGPWDRQDAADERRRSILNRSSWA